jgi:hypothetical protein
MDSDATGNWWGAQSGPKIASNPKGTGDAINDAAGQVDYSGFLTTASDQSSETGFQCDPAATLYAVDATNKLLRFRTISLGAVTKPITGLQGGETIRGIDFRPTTAELFAIGSTESTVCHRPDHRRGHAARAAKRSAWRHRPRDGFRPSGRSHER